MATTPTAVDPRDTALTSPSAALAALLAGNARFAAGRPRHGHLRTPAGRSPVQHPFALVLACLDSRVTPEAVLDQDFGAVMAVRTGGHVLDDAVLGSVDFAVSVVGVPLLFVLAHRYCGGVAATVSAGRDGFGRLIISDAAIAAVIAEGKDVTYDLKPDRDDPTAVGTREFADAVIGQLAAVHA